MFWTGRQNDYDGDSDDDDDNDTDDDDGGGGFDGVGGVHCTYNKQCKYSFVPGKS